MRKTFQELSVQVGRNTVISLIPNIKMQQCNNKKTSPYSIALKNTMRPTGANPRLRPTNTHFTDAREPFSGEYRLTNHP